MGIFYVQYRAEPTPESDVFEICGGAYINCWVTAESVEEAERVSFAAVTQAGWEIEGVEEDCREVTVETYYENDEGREYFEQALADGECYVFHQWPIEPQEEDEVH